MLSRGVASPAYSSTSRDTLDLRRQEAIDVFLKEIKAPIRRTKLVQSILTGESSVLERLYYKGKNQHGSSLFWRRLSEMRRYTRRLQELDLLSLLEAVRAAFYHVEPSTSSRRLKGAWTHYPASSYFVFVLEQLRAAVALTKKTMERLGAIYQFVNLVMQNGAFLQLTLVVAAIISRINQAAADLRLVLEDFAEKCRKLMEILYRGKSAPLHASSGTNATLSGDAPHITLEEHAAASELDLTEDIGLSLDQMGGAIAPGRRTVDIPPLPSVGGSSSHTISQECSLSASNTAVKPDANSQTEIFTSSPVSSSVLVKRKANKDDKKAGVKKAKKAKIHKDEIDDIFGMF